MEKKITLSEFLESEEVLGIQCDTKQQSSILLEKMIGEVECYNDWNKQRDNTIYLNCATGFFHTSALAKIFKAKIYNFEEVDLGK